MYIRTRTYKNKDGSTRTYVYIVEGKRINGKVRQEVIANLGRLESLQEKSLDTLIKGLARFSRKQWIQDQARKLDARWARELGPALVFRRLWEDLNLDRILNKLLAGTKVTSNVEEALFAMVLNRLCYPQSKLGVSRWLDTVYRPEFEDLELQYFYRSLDFLAEHKDRIEVNLFDRIRDLFNIELDLVFWDTTSTYFEGSGPEGLAQHGFSKDHRPDRYQVVIGILMTRDGTPVAHQVFLGNTADVDTFKMAMEDLKKRFKIRRVILAGDRGMVSRKVLRQIEDSGLEYIVGVRMRRLKAMDGVLNRPGRYRTVRENLKVKEVVKDGTRYIVCLNPEEAEHDRRAREEMALELKQKLKNGFKSLVGNRGYRRYLKVDCVEVTIDQEALKEETRFDGKYVLETNSELAPDEVALAYKDLWRVERAFRELKSGLDLRPIYHWSESRVRGHIMVCFLAFVLETALRKRLLESGCDVPYQHIVEDLKQLKTTWVLWNVHFACPETMEFSGFSYVLLSNLSLLITGF